MTPFDSWALIAAALILVPMTVWTVRLWRRRHDHPATDDHPDATSSARHLAASDVPDRANRVSLRIIQGDATTWQPIDDPQGRPSVRTIPGPHPGPETLFTDDETDDR